MTLQHRMIMRLEVGEMREIKFRGKRLANGEWVYGKLLAKQDKAFIVEEAETSHGFKNGKELFAVEWTIAEVSPSTVGQFIGLLDKNGKEAFEGDKAKTHYKNTQKDEYIETIVFHNGCFRAEYEINYCGKMYALLGDGIYRLPRDKSVYIDEFEIIGNIFDNPELMEAPNDQG
jgi:uncharacterized phage protein (TIGR01671 family)